MNEPPDPEDLPPEWVVRALQRYRDRGFAELILVAIDLAASHYPEEMRKALAQVFDLSEVEKGLKRHLALATEVSRKAGDARAQLGRLAAEVAALEKKVSDLKNTTLYYAEKRK